MGTTVRYRFYRDQHSLRRRGITLAGEHVDETRVIPASAFLARGVTADELASSRVRDRQRVEQVAHEIARDEERRDNDPAQWNADDGEEFSFTRLWQEYRAKNLIRVQSATLRKNESQARHIIRIFEKAMRLKPSGLTLGRMEDYLTQRITVEHASPKTAFLEAGFARQLVQWGLDRSEETHVMTISVRRLPDVAGKSGIRPKTILSERQLFALYAAARQLPERGDMLRRIIGFVIGTRLRRTALLGLMGEWCDRHDAWLRIPAAPGIVKGRLHHRDPIELPLPRIALDMIDDLPADGPVWLSKYRRAPRADEAEILIATAQKMNLDARDVLIVSLTKRHKISAPGVSALQWDQVDLDAGILRRARQLLGKPGVFVDVHLQPDDVARLRELPRLGAHVILSRVSRVNAEPLGAGGIHDVCAAVDAEAALSSREPTSITELDGSLARACEIAGVPRISLQGLRRSATQLLREHQCERHTDAVDEAVVERLLCHSQPALKVAYGRISESQMRAVLDRVDCAYERHCGGDDVGVVDIRAAARRRA